MLNISLLNFYLSSPLDQFGTDSDFVGVLDNFITDFIPASSALDDLVSFIGLTEFDSAADWLTIILANSGTLLFDDEDSSDSQWEESNVIISGLQASIFSANILGMIPGL